MTRDLTSEKRRELWDKLTPIQQETLQRFKKYRMQSLFLTENFLMAEEWRFVDFKENPAYPHGEENKLFCRCGRELKYQFLLVSEKTGEELALGATHFAQHLGVSPKIAKQIQSGIHTLDRGVDLILTSVDKGLHFPKRYYNLFLSRGLTPQCSDSFLERVAAFSKADLPLYEEDNQKLIACLKKSGFQLQTIQFSAAKQTPDPSFKHLIGLLQSYEIGEVIYEEKLADTLTITAKDLKHWLSILEAPKCPVQLKKVGTNYYRIR